MYIDNFILYIRFYDSSSVNGNCMKENHARMNFPLSFSAEGAPDYEQRELYRQRRVPLGTASPSIGFLKVIMLFTYRRENGRINH